MKVSGRMTKWKVRATILGLMGKNMKVNGRMGKRMERVSYFMKMEVKWNVCLEMTDPGKLCFQTKNIFKIPK